jgi:hypothetical protein
VTPTRFVVSANSFLIVLLSRAPAINASTLFAPNGPSPWRPGLSAIACLKPRRVRRRRAADGCLRCQANPAELESGQRVVFVRANTWMTNVQADGCTARRVPPAVDRDDALGAFWLAPPPLRRRLPDGRYEVLTAAIEAF